MEMAAINNYCSIKMNLDSKFSGRNLKNNRDVISREERPRSPWLLHASQGCLTIVQHDENSFEMASGKSKPSKVFLDNAVIRMLCVVIVMLTSTIMRAEIPALERVITIHIQNEKISEALRKISQLAGVTFSYSSSVLNVDKIVNQNFVDQTVREVVDKLFDGDVKCKARGNYLILTRPENSPKTITGYVTDGATGERLKEVTVYDPATLQSAITNEFGYFEIKIDKPTADDVTLIMKRYNYADTVLVLPKTKRPLQKINLNKSKTDLKRISDSITYKVGRWWASGQKQIQHIHKKNIRDTLYREGQISFLPFLGTNHKLSGVVENGYSLNVLGGYSAGTRKAEVGGLFNINRGNVRAVQLAGLFNANGGSTAGTQLAGLWNLNGGSTMGIQMAGLFNLNVRRTRGVQLAGLFNVCWDSVQATQVAGLINVVRKNMKGPQVAGLINVSENITGAQVSGLINAAKTVNGSQVGFINIADSIKGVPIGFLSFVRKGYHQLELSSDEIFPINLAFRTGVKHFHNIISGGVQIKSDTIQYSLGYGVGSLLKLTKRLSFNTELSHHQLVRNDSYDWNTIEKLFAGFDFRIGKKTSMVAGATLNLHIFDNEKISGQSVFSNYYEPNLLGSGTWNNTGYQWWLGGKVGVRFL
jgi:hypothetical protein